MLKAFQWDSYYNTGIDIVDREHQQLVNLLNALISVIVNKQQISEKELFLLLDKLGEYAKIHFSDEEKIMFKHKDDNSNQLRHQLYNQHLRQHLRQHNDFVKYVVAMREEYLNNNSSKSKNEVLEELAHYITVWLSFHILGSDQEMANFLAEFDNQPRSINIEDRDRASRALLSAMEKLYEQMAKRNSQLVKAQAELSDLNANLEKRVEERTKELSEALSEVESTRKRLVQSEKMSAIGQLAAGVAHEINNPVGFVNSNLGTLKQYVEHLLNFVKLYEENIDNTQSETFREILRAFKENIDYDFLKDDILDLLNESTDGLNRVKRIVQDMKVFLHVDKGEWEESDINEILDSTINVVWHEIKYKAELEKRYDKTIPRIKCLPAKLSQVFMNILVNACQAIETNPGKIIIETKVSANNSNLLEIKITDNGRGMPENVIKHVFEPFYTTKAVGKGTGLGLSLSYEIIQHHGGDILVESEVGKGTKFTVILPVNLQE